MGEWIPLEGISSNARQKEGKDGRCRSMNPSSCVPWSLFHIVAGRNGQHNQTTERSPSHDLCEYYESL